MNSQPREDDSLTQAAQVLFLSQESDEVLSACEAVAGEALQELRLSVQPAIRGNAMAVSRYVRAFRKVTEVLLESAHRWRPDLFVRTKEGLTIVDDAGKPAGFSRLQLLMGAAEAPFTTWLTTYEPGAGVSLETVSRLRSYLLGLEPLRPPSLRYVLPHWEGIDEESWMRFRHLVEGEIERSEGSRGMLARVERVFALNLTELGKLFGVSRQAVTGWLNDGVPVERLAKLRTVLDLGQLLDRKLRPGRLAAVCRQPAAAYGGLSMLEMIAADRDEELLEDAARSFDWAATA